MLLFAKQLAEVDEFSLDLVVYFKDVVYQKPKRGVLNVTQEITESIIKFHATLGGRGNKNNQ